MLREPSRPAQPAAAPRPAGAVPATASAPQNGPAAAPIPAVEPGKVVPRLIEAIRRDSPALASALEKCIGSSVDEGDLLLTFQSRDRFAGELVLKEKDSLGQRASALLARPVRLRVAFQEARVEQARVDQRVELLRKVFRGEVVKGEGRGTEPV
jgi:hypothetical protein